MIEFTVRVDVDQLEISDGVSFISQYISRRFSWPVLPRIGESIDLDSGHFTEVKDVVHWLSDEPEIMLFVEVNSALFEHLLQQTAWKKGR